MAAESPELQTEQGSDHVRASEQQILSELRYGAHAPGDSRWRPPSEAVGGAIAGGVAAGYVFGPLGALVGMVVGAAIAVGTTRHFATRTH